MSKNEVSPPIRTGDPRITKEPTVELKETAYGICKNSDGKWTLVELKYDLDSGKAEITKRLPQDNRDFANENFKINVVKSGILK